MPTYHVDLTTDRGLQRMPFTLDDDRPVGGQIQHILEELRQRNLILRGGPEDVLVVRWNGGEIDAARTPQALGLNPMYPIELQMRSRAVQAARREPPPEPFLPKSGYIGPVAGMTGGGLAWIVGSLLFTDLGEVLSSHGALDIAVMAMVGALIGASVLGMAASVRAEGVGIGVALGALLGVLGGVVGSLGGLLLAGAAGLGGSRQSFVVARLIVWGLSGGLIGLLLGLRWVGRDRLRAVEGLLYGLGAGVLGGLVMSLPGPTDLWQLLAFLILGAAIGAGLSIPGVRRAIGVIELDRVAGSSVGLIRHRGWEVALQGATPLGRSLEIRVDRGRCQLVPTGTASAEPLQLGGKPISGPTDIVNQDPIAIGNRVFRFRRFPDSTV